MAHAHHFTAVTVWTGAEQGPTHSYEGYSRQYLVQIEGKPDMIGSAAAPFRGDAALYNPEDLLLAALSACHMLSFLAIAARAGVPVSGYRDQASATMSFHDGKMRFVEAILRPSVTVHEGVDPATLEEFHHRANQECFIANSVNFPVLHYPVLRAH
ncbi:MAG: OsmC family protein [Fimbriimonas sp.]|nr:OsmC family protein [Fimbriimonas sp.]